MLAASTNSKSAKVVLPVEFDLHQTEAVVGDNRAERHEHHRGCHVRPVEPAGERGVYEDAGGHNAFNPTTRHTALDSPTRTSLCFDGKRSKGNGGQRSAHLRRRHAHCTSGCSRT